MPQTVLERVAVLGHVTGQGLGTDGKVYAGPLKYREQEKEERKQHEAVIKGRNGYFLQEHLWIYKDSQSTFYLHYMGFTD